MMPTAIPIPPKITSSPKISYCREVIIIINNLRSCSFPLSLSYYPQKIMTLEMCVFIEEYQENSRERERTKGIKSLIYIKQ